MLAAATVTRPNLLGGTPGARVGRVGRITTAAIPKAATQVVRQHLETFLVTTHGLIRTACPIS